MPAQIFTEGQDPLDTPGVNPAGRMPTGAPPPDPFSYPTGPQIMGAAFRQNNPVVSALDALSRGSPDMTPVPGYNPVKQLSGTKDDDLIEQSLADVNPAQTDARIAKKNAEIKDQQTLSASGWSGTVASVAAGAMDPSWFVPILGEAHAAAGLGLAMRVGRGLGEGLGKSAISETLMQSSQVTRTPQASAENIATNTVLMGLIGGGLGMLSPAERVAANNGLDAVRKDLSPVTAYHGSPHEFDAFQNEAIGTGQGAQTYGHGLYFAEHPDVAKGYTETLGGSVDPIKRGAYQAVQEYGSPDAALATLEPRLARMKAGPSLDSENTNFLESLVQEIKTSGGKSPSSMYQVNIHADKDAMLDLDKSLSEQTPAVQASVKQALGIDYYGKFDQAKSDRMWESAKGATGETAVRNGLIAADDKTVSQRLSDAGIPGSKYLDQGSRPRTVALNEKTTADVRAQIARLKEELTHKDDPGILPAFARNREANIAALEKSIGENPTRNYVVFNDKDVEITHKNGVPITSAAKQPELPFHDQTSIIPDGIPEPKTLATDLSAASSDKRSMQLSRIMLPDNMMSALKQVPGVGAAIDWTSKVLMGFSPTLRVFSSGSLIAKRAMGDLAETSLRFTQADSGITSARGGIPLDRLVKMQTHDGQLTGSQILRDQFIAYRGLEDSKLPMQSAMLADARGQAPGKLSFDDFKTQVSGAMTNGDVHAVPQIQQAAQLIRQQVLDPVTRLAQRTMGPDGKPMLADALEPPKGDKSFFPRIWNKRSIAAGYNDIKKTFTDWLESEQGIKAAAKDRITGHSERLDASEKRIANLETKIEAYPVNNKARADHEYTLRLEIEKRDGIRAALEKEINDWHGDSVTAAKAALRARAKAEVGRDLDKPKLRAADPEVDAAVRTIMKSPRDLSRQELDSRAAEIVNRINTAPDGRLPYDIANGGPQMGPPGEHQQVRGSLNSRDFAIPTSLVKDYVNTDTEHVISSHLRTVLPDIHLTDRFGDVEMTDVFKKINDEYDAKLASAKSAKQQTALDAEKKAMVRDLAATRDRVRNTYGWEMASTQPNAARIANVARNYNLIADLGTSVFNRLTDSTNAVWRHGLMNVFGDGYFPFLKSMLGMGDGFATTARQSMKDMGVGIDSAIGNLSRQWGDVIDNNMPGSKFERALAWSANKSMMVNLHGPWTDSMKTMSGTVAAADFLRTAERISGGTHTPADLQRMAQAGIEPAMATRIWAAYKDGGGQEFGTGTHIANTADWTDTQARDVFSSAIARDADMAVLTPGMEKPLWMSSPIVSLLGQFKSFVAAAHEKVLISNMQQMDARTLQGLIASLGMGMISYRAYTLWSGAPVSDRPQDWIKEGISRSVIMGWFSEINSMQAKFSGGATDMFRAIGADHPLSRRQSNGALSELLGPTYSRLEGIAGGVNDAFHGTWTAMDTHKFRQAIFLQNLFAVRRLLDSAEDGFNERMGVKPLNRDPSMWPGAKLH